MRKTSRLDTRAEDLPFYSKARSIHCRDRGPVPLKPYQILLFASITEHAYETPNRAPIFPALLDTGNSLCLTLSERQLEAAKPWGMTLPPIEKTYSIKDAWGNSHEAKAFFGAVWIQNYIWDDMDKSLKEIGAGPMKLALGESGIACVVSKKGHTSPANAKRGRSLRKFWDNLWHGASKRAAGPGNPEESMLIPEPKHNPSTHRLSLPHVPLLGLRALCLDALNLELNCTSEGGRLTIEAPDLAPSGALP
jgi:hypothetical protein